MPYKPDQELESLDLDQYYQFLKEHLPLGADPHTRIPFYISEQARYSAMSLLGLPEMGKSACLENIFALSAATGDSTILVDPHGDSIPNVIARLPEELVAKTYYLNMEDVEYPFALNIFGDVDPTDEIQLAQAVNRVMHIFETQWEDIMTQSHLPRYLRMTTIALLCNKDCTLADMYKFLTDASFRHDKLKAVKDETVLAFWQRFDEMTPSVRNQQIESLLTRLESIFAGRSMIRNLLGQPRTSINFRKMIEDGDILLVRLPIKNLKHEAKLVGSILISLLHSALFSFADTPPDKRPGFTLILDEWQNFASSDIAELVTEGRKFRVKLCVANQFLGQLPPYLQEALDAMRTKICFRLTHEDAKKKAYDYLDGQHIMRPEDIERKPVEHLLDCGSDVDTITVFIETYLQPVRRAPKKNGQMEVKRPGFMPQKWLNAFLQAPAPNNPTVADPFPDLNTLLYEVMKNGNADIRIPSGIVEGFANCGRGFYPVFKWSFKRGELLSSNIEWPPDLVTMTEDGYAKWDHKPKNGKEQLYHFLFHLRLLIIELSLMPIGKESAVTPSEVAQELMQLPKRHAFVRSGEEMGIIVTDDTLEPVSASDLITRLKRIQAQTRQKYCRPKSEIEKEAKSGTKSETKVRRSEAIK